MTYQFSAMITQDQQGMYTARVPLLRGCHTQAKSLPLLQKRLLEVIELCIEVERSKRLPIVQDKFVAVQQMEVCF